MSQTTPPHAYTTPALINFKASTCATVDVLAQNRSMLTPASLGRFNAKKLLNS